MWLRPRCEFLLISFFSAIFSPLVVFLRDATLVFFTSSYFKLQDFLAQRCKAALEFMEGQGKGDIDFLLFFPLCKSFARLTACMFS